ncbi:MAG: SDR family oxidoreductase [Smithella sp.]|nr:SDR family oxidoreductase [Smithella sp.]
MKSLTGKTILITGAAGGLGQEYTKQLLNLGAHIILADLNELALKKISDQYKKTPGTILGVVEADVSGRRGCDDLYRKTRTLAPHLDILMNNAGIINYGYFWEIPYMQWEALININLLAPMWLSQLFLPDMVERKSGHIVFMCSLAGIAATSLGTPYTTSKFGMRGFAMALSGEMKDKGLHTTIIYPSWVKTNLLKSPEFGSAQLKSLSSFLAEDPVKVVKESINGIRKNKLHVYPGLFAKIISQVAKLTPLVSRQSH